MLVNKLSDFLGLSNSKASHESLIVSSKDTEPLNTQKEFELEKKDPEETKKLSDQVSGDEVGKKLLHEWKIDVETKKLPQKYKSSLMIIGFLSIVFSIMTQDFIFVIMVLSLVFLYNITVSVPKRTLTFKIYNSGLDYLGSYYPWNRLRNFFFYPDSNMMGVDTVDVFPGRLYFYYHLEDKNMIDETIFRYLDKSLVVPKNYLEKIIDKLKPLFNLKD